MCHFAFRVRARLISKKILGSENVVTLMVYIFLLFVSYHPQFLYSPNLIFAGRVSEFSENKRQCQ